MKFEGDSSLHRLMAGSLRISFDIWSIKKFAKLFRSMTKYLY
jgi:hypothetical protein